ncbi:MAG: DNA gyrase inhibitor YacG, partial [Mariprofundus sp.]
MSATPVTIFRCPICKKPVKRNAEDFPFCTSRCRVIDLGRWASEEYRIAGDPV